MAKQQAPMEALRSYLPPGSFEPVLYYLQHYKVHLTITRERASVLGDYRNQLPHKNHRISVNGNLNTYAFLITLLHELAHLLTYERHGHRVQAHGPEWKTAFSQVLAQFLEQGLFPDDVAKALQKTIRNPAASSCADTGLLRVLHRYNARKPGWQLVETLPDGSLFKLKDGRVFKRQVVVRKRIKCVEVATGKAYLFSPVYEVEQVLTT
jgi:SprT protein